jgi:hypothetical protein
VSADAAGLGQPELKEQSVNVCGCKPPVSVGLSSKLGQNKHAVLDATELL